MCATPRPKRQVVLAMLAADVATPAAVVAATAALVMSIPSASMPVAVVGAPPSVAKKAKASKESALATLDESAVC